MKEEMLFKPVVLLINDYSFGGGAEQVFNNHWEIIREDYIVKTLVGSSNKDDPGIFQHFFSFKFLFRTFRVLKREQPDIIHIHNFHNFLSPSILLSILLFKKFNKKKQKVVFTAHDFHLICPDALFGYYKNGHFKKIEVPLTTLQIFSLSFSNKSRLISFYKKMRWFFNYKVLHVEKAIDVIVSPSCFLLDKVKHYLPHKSTALIRNPISLNSVNPASISVNKSDEVIKIVFLGRLSMEKGLLEFIDLLYKARVNRFTLSIYGDGPLIAEVEKKIHDCNFQDTITLNGKIDYSEIDAILSCYDVLLLPSICYENAPLVLVEGALKSLRLLTCDYGGMKEIGELCGDVYYFTYKEPAYLADVFNALRRDISIGPPVRNVNKVRDLFSKETYLRDITKLYSCLLN